MRARSCSTAQAVASYRRWINDHRQTRKGIERIAHRGYHCPSAGPRTPAMERAIRLRIVLYREMAARGPLVFVPRP